MKKNILFLTACSALNVCVAQSISPNIISSSGNSFSNSTAQIDYTLGEVNTSTFTDGTSILTQGFQQPNLIITSVNTSPSSNFNLKIFPNPTADILQLQFLDLNTEMIIELYSTEGKLMHTQLLSIPGNIQIDMSSYSSGIYMLSVRSKLSKINTYQIIKSK